MFKHKKVSNVIDFLALGGLFCCLVIFVFVPFRQAQATPTMIPFGGVLLYRDIGSPPPAFCPAHGVIFDYVTHTMYGIMETPGARIYRYGNTMTPSVFLLGEHLPVPIPCARPYPLFGIFQVGTGAF